MTDVPHTRNTQKKKHRVGSLSFDEKGILCANEVKYADGRPQSSSDSEWEQFEGSRHGKQSSVGTTPSSRHGRTPLTPGNIDKVLEGFKGAVEAGNESLVEHHLMEFKYADLELLETMWPNGDCSLHIACRSGFLELAKFLLQRGLSPNEVNSRGDSPVHSAVQGQSVACLCLLIAHSADTNVMNLEHETPLQMAQEQSFKEGVKILEQHSMDFHTQTPPVGPVTASDNTMKRGLTFRSDLYSALPGDKMSKPNISRCTVTPHNTASDNTCIHGLSTAPTPPTNDSAASVRMRSRSAEPRLPEVNPQQRASQSMEAVRLAAKNPFSKMKIHRKTSIMVRGEIRARENLPALTGYLQIRRPNGVLWGKQWVVVTEQMVLWMTQRLKVEFAGAIPTKEELRRFNGAVRLGNIVKVEALHTSEAQNKFVIHTTVTENREVVWKCLDTQERDHWVDTLNRYVKLNKAMGDAFQ